MGTMYYGQVKDKVDRIVTKNLQDFGYDVDVEEVAAICQRLVDGASPSDIGGIVAMFAHTMLDDAGLLVEETGEEPG